MSANSHNHTEPTFESVLDVSSAWMYRLVTSEDPQAVEQFIARLFREYFLERPDEAQELLRRLEEVTNDPVLRSLAYAPDDDEPLTDDDLAAIDEALDEVERDDVASHGHLPQWSGE